MFLTSFRNRLGALVSWAITFSRESRRERAFSLQAVVPGQDLYDDPATPDPDPGAARRAS